jgi:hypothetical protein
VTTAFDSAKDIKAPKQSWPNKKFGGKFERLDEKENLRGFGTGADMADEHLDDHVGGEGWFDFAGGLADGVGFYDFEDDYKDDGNTGSKNAKVGGLGKGFDWKRVAELSVDFRGTPGQEKPELPQGLEVVNSKGVNLKDLKVRVLVSHGPLENKWKGLACCIHFDDRPPPRNPFLPVHSVRRYPVMLVDVCVCVSVYSLRSRPTAIWHWCWMTRNVCACALGLLTV